MNWGFGERNEKQIPNGDASNFILANQFKFVDVKPPVIEYRHKVVAPPSPAGQL